MSYGPEQAYERPSDGVAGLSGVQHRLDAAIADLHKVVEVYAERLTPVLVPDHGPQLMAAESPHAEPPMAPAVARLHALTTGVEEATRRLQVIADRLHL